MPWWMKFYLQKPIEGDGDDAGGGSGGELASSVDGDGDLVDPGRDADTHTDADNSAGASSAADRLGNEKTGERKTGADLTEGMRAAIEEGLKDAGDPVDAGKKKPGADEPGKPAGDDAGAKKGADQNGKKPAAEGEAGKKPPAKADDFQLSAEEKKTLTPKAIGRFHELHKHAKTVEAERDQIREQNVVLTQARETIMTALKDSHTDSNDLAQLLNFNYMIKTGDFDNALQLIENYRTALLKHLGREGQAYDPLAEHPDLAQQVAEQKLQREAALQVAAARATEQRQAMTRQQELAQQRADAEAQREKTTALEAISAWNQKIAASDPAFSEKAAILESKLKDIMSRYSPKHWPTAIEDAYNAIQVPQKQVNQRVGNAGTGPMGDETLRPRGGGRPGPKAAESMLQALQQGLGYASS